MFDVDAARKRVYVCVTRPLRFIQRLSTREHEIGAIEEFRLEPAQLRRRAGKERQLVHAVVDDGRRSEVRRRRQRHRRVEPQDKIGQASLVDQARQHAAEHGDRAVSVAV